GKRCMKVIWVPPINGQAKTMFPPEYTSSDPIPKHTNSFGCLNNNIILFSGLDESGNEKGPAQAVLDGHFAAGSLELGIIRDGLGAYGERILGSSSEYVQSNVSKYFSDPQYYFQVNGQYVRNKLKVILFPFLHRPKSFEPSVHKGTTLMVSAGTATKGRIMWSYSYYFLIPFMCMHGGFLGEDREENSICRDKEL
ncbi:hypothetical protein IFM89_029963, partial [Coptis chinensis]